MQNRTVTKTLDRRQFLTRTGALGLGAAALPSGLVLGAGEKKVRHACIGIGGHGWG